MPLLHTCDLSTTKSKTHGSDIPCSACTCPASPPCSDLSLWSFEKLADTKLGVIAVEWRDVPCGQKPNKPARNPWGQRSGPDRGPPGNWNPAMDKRSHGGHYQGKGRRLRGVNPLSSN